MIKYTGINHKKVATHVGAYVSSYKLASIAPRIYYMVLLDELHLERPKTTMLEKGKFYGRKGKHIEVSDSAPIN